MWGALGLALGSWGTPGLSYCNLSEHTAAAATWGVPAQRGVGTQHLDVSAGPGVVRVRPSQGTELSLSPGLGQACQCSQAGVTAPCPAGGSSPGTQASHREAMCGGAAGQGQSGAAAGLGLGKGEAGLDLLAAGRWDFRLYSHCS